MSTRIHIVVDEAEKERFRREATRRGSSLSEWIREAAREKLADDDVARLDSLETLCEFFRTCDDRESGAEPAWEYHERLIEGNGGSMEAPSTDPEPVRDDDR
jgi:hypothetical protein